MIYITVAMVLVLSYFVYREFSYRCPFCGTFSYHPKVLLGQNELGMVDEFLKCKFCGKVFDKGLSIIWLDVARVKGKTIALEEFRVLYDSKEIKEMPIDFDEWSIGKDFDVKTTGDSLEELGITLVEIQEMAEFLSDCFGKKYFEMYPLSSEFTKLRKIALDSQVLRLISNCAGFKNHLIKYNKANMNSLLNVAKKSAWLIQQGFEVELEPVANTENGAKPDILVQLANVSFAIESEKADIATFFSPENRKKVSDFLFDEQNIQESITYLIDRNLSYEEFRAGVLNKSLVHSF